MNTGLCWTIEATGSDCTRWQLRSLERPSGTTATRRDIETGRPMNLMRLIHVYVTRRTDSRTGYAITTTTTPARKLPVTFSITTCGNHCPPFFSVCVFYFVYNTRTSDMSVSRRPTMFRLHVEYKWESACNRHFSIRAAACVLVARSFHIRMYHART